MKISNVSKIMITAFLLTATIPQLCAWDSLGASKTIQEEADEKRLNSAVDNATDAYNEAKEMLAVMENEKGTDKDKNALYEQANTLFAELKIGYHDTLSDSEASVIKQNHHDACRCSASEYHYDTTKIDKTVTDSNNVLNLYQKMRILHCKFMNPNDESCSQISKYQQHMENVFHNPQEIINDNIQNVINNSTNTGGSCTPTYNTNTHSYDCI